MPDRHSGTCEGASTHHGTAYVPVRGQSTVGHKKGQAYTMQRRSYSSSCRGCSRSGIFKKHAGVAKCAEGTRQGTWQGARGMQSFT
eukprot:5557355-Alexandrium_andersonii.AAC.1